VHKVSLKGKIADEPMMMSAAQWEVTVESLHDRGR
jgi:hypothetical protein